MHKPLGILMSELQAVANERGSAPTMILPSHYDELVERLKQLSGHAMSNGGLERVMELVAAAIQRGEA